IAQQLDAQERFHQTSESDARRDMEPGVVVDTDTVVADTERRRRHAGATMIARKYSRGVRRESFG
ncbi:MAG: hypothetical protein ACTHMA_04220, partial [Thermomicrobiales bacterium]